MHVAASLTEGWIVNIEAYCAPSAPFVTTCYTLKRNSTTSPSTLMAGLSLSQFSSVFRASTAST
jgi:hypothetical protein